MKTRKKRIIKTLTAIAIPLFTLLVGCSKENAPTPSTGEGTAKVEGIAFTTNRAYAWDLGPYSNSTSQNFVLELSNGLNDGIYYSDETTTIIMIDLLSGTSDKIAPGTYTYNHSGAHPSFTFENAYAHTNLLCQQGNITGGDRYEDVEGGSVMVSYPNGVFYIEYNLELANGVGLTGFYSGSVEYYIL